MALDRRAATFHQTTLHDVEVHDGTAVRRDNQRVARMKRDPQLGA